MKRNVVSWCLTMLLAIVYLPSLHATQIDGNLKVDTSISAVASQLMRLKASDRYKQSVVAMDVQDIMETLEVEIALLSKQREMAVEQVDKWQMREEMCEKKESDLLSDTPLSLSRATLDMLQQSCLLEKQRLEWAIRGKKLVEPELSAAESQIAMFDHQERRRQIALLRANREDLTKNVERMKTLFTKGNVSENEFRQEEARLRNEQAALEKLELDTDKEKVLQSLRKNREATELKTQMAQIEMLNKDQEQWRDQTSKMLAMERVRAERARIAVRLEALEEKRWELEHALEEKRAILESIQSVLAEAKK